MGPASERAERLLFNGGPNQTIVGISDADLWIAALGTSVVDLQVSTEELVP